MHYKSWYDDDDDDNTMLNLTSVHTFSSCNERINDNLSTVEEVAELCFPDRQNAWILNTDAVLKAKNGLL